MIKTKYIYLCLMALFSITTFAQYDEFGGNNNGGYANSPGGVTHNGVGIGQVNISVTIPSGNTVPPPYTPPPYVPVYNTGIVINNGPGNYGTNPIGTSSGTSTGTPPTGSNLINKPVLTAEELKQLINDIKGAVAVKVYAYVDSQGKTHIGYLTTITNPNVPSQHLLYFDEIGGTTDHVRLPDNQSGTVFDPTTANNNSYTVTPWNGNNPQPTTNPNSVWIQEPNTGTWYFITPTYNTSVVGVPVVTPTPPVQNPCEQIKELTTPSPSPSNDPNNGSPQNLLRDNIKMLKDKFANPPIPFTGLYAEIPVEVKKNNLDFYSTTVNGLGNNFSAETGIGRSYIGSIHNHPINGVAIPSFMDLKLLLNTYDEVNPINRDEVFVMVVSKELNGNLAVYNLKINNIDKLRAQVNAVWNDPKYSKITNVKEKNDAITAAEAQYYGKAGNDKEKAFLQKNGAFGLDLYKSSSSDLNDWGKLNLESDSATGALIVKKYIIILLFVLNLFKTNAQAVLDISDYDGVTRVQGAYYKDTKNKLDPYVGSYVYTNGTTSLKFVFKKVLSKNGSLYSEDLIVGEYQYIENGVEKANTLNRFNLNYTADDVWKHSVDSNYIADAASYCTDCSPNEEHLYASLFDINAEAGAIFDVKKIMHNGKEAIRVIIGWRMREHKENDPPLLQPFMPGGQYILTKEAYTNTIKTGTFKRNNCGAGQTGSSVLYTVPAGKYTSTISQADADAQAQADVNANGQNNANNQGTCKKGVVKEVEPEE
jgi:hypothetical protein